MFEKEGAKQREKPLKNQPNKNYIVRINHPSHQKELEVDASSTATKLVLSNNRAI